jgi:hypothetical protein
MKARGGGEAEVQEAMMAAAIVYIPAGRTIDLKLARQYWAYMQQRGYDFYAVARNLRRALDDLDAGKAQVVVMLTPDAAPRADPDMTTVIDLRAKRDRMLADEPTVRLPSPNAGPAPQPLRDDGGFADRFLADRRNRRNSRDT